MTFDGASADAERVGDLGLAEVAVVAQDEDFTLPGRQLAQRIDHRRAVELAQGSVLRACGIRHGLRRVLRLDLAPPDPRPGTVDHCLSEVALRLLRVAQPAP